MWTWTGTSAAEATFICANDSTHTQTVNATLSETVDKEPTYTEEGSKTVTAKVTFDGKDYTDTKTVSIPKLDVNYTKVSAVPAACETAGNIEYYIGTDGKYYKYENGVYTEISIAETSIPAAGHSWGEWIVTKEPTYTEAGEKQRVCANDPTHIETEVIPAKEAVYFTVTFDSANGTAVSAQTVHDGNTAVRPADPTRSGYTFRYWTLNGTEYNFNAPVTGNITLTAVWTENYVPAPTPAVPETPTYIMPEISTGTGQVNTATPTIPETHEYNITGVQTADNENELTWDAIPEAKDYSLYIKVNGKNVFVQNLGSATSADIVRSTNGKFYVSTGEDYTVYSYKNGKFVKTGTLPADQIDTVNRANNVTTNFTVKYTKANGSLSSDKESYNVSVKVYYKPAVKATVKDGKTTLSWDKVPGATKYRVYRSVNGKMKLLKETDKAKLTVSSKSGEYTYAVRAYVNGEWTTVYKSDLITVEVE